MSGNLTEWVGVVTFQTFILEMPVLNIGQVFRYPVTFWQFFSFFPRKILGSYFVYTTTTTCVILPLDAIQFRVLTMPKNSKKSNLPQDLFVSGALFCTYFVVITEVSVVGGVGFCWLSFFFVFWHRVDTRRHKFSMYPLVYLHILIYPSPFFSSICNIVNHVSK